MTATRIGCDWLIEAGWVIPLQPSHVVLENHAVVVNKGLIEAILTIAQANDLYAPKQHIQRPNAVLMPSTRIVIIR